MSTQNTTPDTWATRIEQSAKVMGITPEKVEAILNSPGFEIVEHPCGLEMLSDDQVTPFGDLRKLFCEENGIAVPKLRMAVKYLRGPKEIGVVTDTTQTVDPDLLELQRKFGINIKLKLEDLGAEELIPLYKPLKNNKITESLRKRYGNKAIIAFKPDTNEVAVDETINYLVDLEQGFQEEDTIEVDGELVRLVPIGIVPDQQLDEDPLCQGLPLKRNRSTANRIKWEGIPTETRQFFRILYERGDIKTDAANRITLMQLLQKDINDLKTIFPEAYLSFKEMKSKNELPTLKVSTLNSYSSTKKNDPFGINTNRKY